MAPGVPLLLIAYYLVIGSRNTSPRSSPPQSISSKQIKYSEIIYLDTFTWNTVSMAIEKESKFDAGVPKSKLKVPPNSCIPSNANISMKRKRSRRSDTIDLRDAKRETTRLRREDQYLAIIK